MKATTLSCAEVLAKCFSTRSERITVMAPALVHHASAPEIDWKDLSDRRCFCPPLNGAQELGFEYGGAVTQPRFLKLTDVADELSISMSQAYALVKNGALPAIQVGGRNQWRIERAKLEEYIVRMYEETARNLKNLSLEELEVES